MSENHTETITYDDPGEWDDKSLAELHEEPALPALPAGKHHAAVRPPLTQQPWDLRYVHRLRQVDHVLGFIHASLHRPTDTVVRRGAVMLLAEEDAPDAERIDGISPLSMDAYLADRGPLPPPEAQDRTQACPHCRRRYVRLDRHIKRQHRTAK